MGWNVVCKARFETIEVQEMLNPNSGNCDSWVKISILNSFRHPKRPNTSKYIHG
jgi:hypothetical protein